MKKIIQRVAVITVAFVAVVLTTFAAMNLFDSINSADRLPFASDSVLTAEKPFTVTTTEKQTQPTTITPKPQDETKPIIDLDTMTIIDLYPLSLVGGDWDVKHCQGIAVDTKNEYIYFSYTTMLLKCDFYGNIIGSVSGFDGHLGDIALNQADGRLYCSYYTTGRKGFYVVIFNVSKIKKTNMKPTNDIVRTVFIKEAWLDYKADLNDDGILSPGETDASDHRYACGGIDATGFGPSFNSGGKGKDLLTIGYIVYSRVPRNDNNYQVLLQYDVSGWWKTYGKPYSSTEFHQSGPEKPAGKYFVYTGSTLYGVQTIEYFDELKLWLLNCYKTLNSQFQPYTLFAVDEEIPPEKKQLSGQPQPDEQYVLTLYNEGSYSSTHDIYGFKSAYGVQGMSYIGNGLFYIAVPYQNWTGTKAAICYLYAWNPKKQTPFILATDIGNDYKIGKKYRTG